MAETIKQIPGWYTAAEAAKRLSEHSGRTVKPEYLRTLARLGRVDTKKIGNRVTLYAQADVDAYVVTGKRGRPPKRKVDEVA